MSSQAAVGARTRGWLPLQLRTKSKPAKRNWTTAVAGDSEQALSQEEPAPAPAPPVEAAPAAEEQGEITEALSQDAAPAVRSEPGEVLSPEKPEAAPAPPSGSNARRRGEMQDPRGFEP